MAMQAGIGVSKIVILVGAGYASTILIKNGKETLQSAQHLSMAAAQGVSLNHIARESADVNRLAQFYKEILGFEEVESPEFGDFEVIWLRLPPSFSLHLIERDPNTKLPEGPYSTAASAVADPRNLPRGHHISFSVSNFDDFVRFLKEKGIEPFEKKKKNSTRWENKARFLL